MPSEPIAKPKLWSSGTTLAMMLILLVGVKVFNHSAQESIAEPQPVQAPPTEPLASSPFRVLANSAYDGTLKDAIYTRANYLFLKAQQTGDAGGYLQSRLVELRADAIGATRQYGVLTGEAEQFDLASNLGAEIAATALALDWAINGLESQPSSVNLAQIISSLEAFHEQQ